MICCALKFFLIWVPPEGFGTAVGLPLVCVRYQTMMFGVNNADEETRKEAAKQALITKIMARDKDDIKERGKGPK